MRLDELNFRIDQFDRDETDSANRETAADQECSAAKAAADAEFSNDLAAAVAKRQAAYTAADQARKAKRDAERAADAERTTQLKGTFAETFAELDMENNSLVETAKQLAPFQDLIAKLRVTLDPPPATPGDFGVNMEVVEEAKEPSDAPAEAQA